MTEVTEWRSEIDLNERSLRIYFERLVSLEVLLAALVLCLFVVSIGGWGGLDQRVVKRSEK
jgi:hypothetical protein